MYSFLAIAIQLAVSTQAAPSHKVIVHQGSYVEAKSIKATWTCGEWQSSNIGGSYRVCK